MGAVPSAHPGGCKPLPRESLEAWFYRHSGGRARGIRRPQSAERLRRDTAWQQRSGTAEREVFRTRRLDRRARERVGNVRRHASDVGRQVEQSEMGVGPEIFTAANAERYGEWLGRRYRDAGIIWILGGDRPVETDTQREVLSSMARGLKKGDGSTHLITFHPGGGHSSAEYFHDEPWLDFNMRQNGHGTEFTGRYDMRANASSHRQILVNSSTGRREARRRCNKGQRHGHLLGRARGSGITLLSIQRAACRWCRISS
jgi:Protein of unknown function (DUF4038)